MTDPSLPRRFFLLFLSQSTDLHRTTTGIFVGSYSSFGLANMAPDETMLKGHLMSSLADQVPPAPPPAAEAAEEGTNMRMMVVV